MLREAVYNKRKNALFRRATELSTMCACEVAIVVFSPDGEMAQYSTSSMENLLRRYSRACTDLHEVHTKDEMSKRAAENAAGQPHAPANKRSRKEDDATDTVAAMLAMHDMPPDTATETAPLGAVAEDLIDEKLDQLIQQRAQRAQHAQQKQAQQQENGGPVPVASPSPLLPPPLPPTTAAATATATTTTQNADADISSKTITNTFDSLAAMLAGTIDAPPATTAAVQPPPPLPPATTATTEVQKQEEAVTATAAGGDGGSIISIPALLGVAMATEADGLGGEKATAAPTTAAAKKKR